MGSFYENFPHSIHYRHPAIFIAKSSLFKVHLISFFLSTCFFYGNLFWYIFHVWCKETKRSHTVITVPNKGNNKITELRAIFQRKRQYKQADKISQQPEKWENCNGPDLVQAFPKKWWAKSDFTAPKSDRKIIDNIYLTVDFPDLVQALNSIIPTICLCSIFCVSERGKMYHTYSMFSM